MDYLEWVSFRGGVFKINGNVVTLSLTSDNKRSLPFGSVLSILPVIMIRRLLLFMMVLLSASIAVAQEVTPPPEIYVDQGDWEYVVKAIGEGDVHLFKDGVEVENPYLICLSYDEYTFVFEAYAQLAGCLPSERVYREVYVPPMEPPVPPVLPDGGIIVTVTDTTVILEPYINHNEYSFSGMYVDGCPVDNPCTLPRVNEHYWVDVTTVFSRDVYEQPLDYHNSIMVPALEGQTQDLNCDGEVNIADINYLTGKIMGSAPCEGPCDLNGDGEVNIADVNALVNYILTF